jgi:hypothetical protein
MILNIYIYICVYMYIHIHIHTHIYIYIYIYIFFLCVCVWAQKVLFPEEGEWAGKQTNSQDKLCPKPNSTNLTNSLTQSVR